ncbi:tRNA (guanosine(46)-N7)-methyltransferase TrmB [Noviherbaspirillum massiliense]|uniref:tRNA (guanosine(46)-N7)-methyltransferase TrmB n=2 Tax=Noviherbaspirillum massiliense TaxID=1465823 RepID=UPI0002F88E18|nr:tRNA (guanosine(46)-N7)-methyltransferase TrmB [Noviherbaspirillum massiliense]
MPFLFIDIRKFATLPSMSDKISDAAPRQMLYDPTERRIRSFVTRAGRLSDAQAKAIETLGPRFCIPYAKAPFDFRQAFGREAPLILEIGFGMGDTTAKIAAGMPDKDFLGVEVHTPGIGSLLKLIGEQGLSNLRLIQHDAVEVLRDMIAPESLAGVHIFFPDPWHKARHNKRRLIQPPFVSQLVSRIACGGYLHCATDWQDYAEQMLEVLGAEPALENTAEGYAPRPEYRPVTKFENRGLKLGHGVWDLVFRKR